MAYPDWRGSQYSTVTGSSQKFAAAIVQDVKYVLTTTVALYFKVAVTGGSASVAAGSHLLPAGGSRVISTDEGAALFVHVIRATGESDGAATLSIVEGAN